MTCQLRAALKLLLHLLRNDASAIDAAHIIPWSLSHDDAPRNGMALCRLCHWTFDEGLLTVSARYHVVASPQLSARRNTPGHLPNLHGQDIIGPAEQTLWPDLDALSWHRRNVFRGR